MPGLPNTASTEQKPANAAGLSMFNKLRNLNEDDLKNKLKQATSNESEVKN
jgi:hypothetical protein